MAAAGGAAKCPADLCVGKFQPLRGYFEGVEFDELRRLTEDDIVECVALEHRLLLKILLRSGRFGPAGAAFAGDPFARPPPPQRTPAGAPPSLLYLHDSLITCKFSGMPAPPGMRRMERLLEDLQQEKCAFELVEELDLSSNKLFDEDLEYVVHLVQMLPKCRFVDLSDNHFHGYRRAEREDFDKRLDELLRKAHVNIAVNPFASGDRADYFAKVDLSLLSKLIWIPEEWLAAGNWKSIVPQDRQETVFATHQKFY